MGVIGRSGPERFSEERKSEERKRSILSRGPLVGGPGEGLFLCKRIPPCPYPPRKRAHYSKAHYKGTQKSPVREMTLCRLPVDSCHKERLSLTLCLFRAKNEENEEKGRCLPWPKYCGRGILPKRWNGRREKGNRYTRISGLRGERAALQ